MARKGTIAVSAAYAAQGYDGVVEVNATSGALAITIPSPLGNHDEITIVKTDTTVNAVTITPRGTGNTINGVASFVLRRPGQSVTLKPNGATSYRAVSDQTVSGGAANVALTSSATISVVTTSSEDFTLTAGHTATLNATSPGVFGQRLRLFVLTSGTNSFTLTFGTNLKSAGTLATGTVDAKKFVVEFVSDGVEFLEVRRTAAL